MSKIRRLILALVLVTGLLAQIPDPAFACTCAINPSPLEELNQSTAVFTGRVISVDMPKGMSGRGHPPVRVTLEVASVWKGPIKKRMTVFTAVDSGACGFDFNVGWQYLVYARGPENSLEANICTRTTLLSYAQEDLKFLGNGISHHPGMNIGRYVAIILVAGIIFGLVSFFVFWKPSRDRIILM